MRRDKVILELEESIDSLNEELQEKEKTAKGQAMSLASLKEEKERIVQALEQETQKGDSILKRCNALEQQLAQSRSGQDKLESRLQDAGAQLVLCQNQCSKLDKRIAALNEENLDLRKRLSMSSTEISGAAEDLRLMTRENQAVTAGSSVCHMYPAFVIFE